MSFCDWVILFSIMSSRFIHVTCDNIYFLRLNNVSSYVNTAFCPFICLWTFGLLPPDYVNAAAVNTGVQISLQEPPSILLGIYPEVGLLGHRVLFLIFSFP